MPWYPEEKIEEVRSRSDIVEIIGGYVKLKRSGGGYVAFVRFITRKPLLFL